MSGPTLMAKGQQSIANLANHRFSHEICFFPAKFPLNQSIEGFDWFSLAKIFDFSAVGEPRPVSPALASQRAAASVSLTQPRYNYLPTSHLTCLWKIDKKNPIHRWFIHKKNDFP